MSAGTPTSPGFPLGVSGPGSLSAAASPRAVIAGSGSRPGSNVGSRPATPLSGGSAVLAGSMGGLSAEDVRRWSQSDVTSWLQSQRLTAHATAFVTHDISGGVLLDVDQAALKEMGITAVGDRIRVFTAIKQLKKRCAETAAANSHSRGSVLGVRPVEGEIEYLQSDAFGHVSSPLGAPNGRRPQHSRPPPLHLSQSAAHDLPVTPTAPSPVGSLNGGQGLGLREARRLGTGSVARSPASGANKPLPDVREDSHRKVGSASGAAAFAPRPPPPSSARSYNNYAAPGGRPSTATGSSYNASLARAGQADSSSPTTSSFSHRPSTSDGNGRLQGIVGSALPIAQHANPLTPITETSRSPTTPSFSNSNSLGASNDRGYTVGRGPFGASRPITPNTAATSLGSLTPSSLHAAQLPPSLEDLKRRTIKFIGEDGTTRIVNVSDCRDAHDVLARVLKKFGKGASGNSYAPTAGQTADDDMDGDEGETWGIFATSGEGQIKSLTDNELLAICHAPQPHDPLRERGLTLRRLGTRNDYGRPAPPKRNKLESFFGERMPGVHTPGSPDVDSSDSLDVSDYVAPTGKKVNRASTVSIMSGLGVNIGGSGKKSASQPPVPSSYRLGPPEAAPSRSTPGSVIPRKARNFFGQRPPSELISSHLTDYFPQAEKRVLERTARRSIYGRPSASIRSKRDSTWSFNLDPDAPPLPGKEGVPEPPSIQIRTPESSEEDEVAQLPLRAKTPAGPPMLPPVIGRSSLDDWSASLQTVGSPIDDGGPSLAAPARKSARPLSQQRRMSGESVRSRKSFATQLRVARGYVGNSATSTKMGAGADRSETASMLTVDEITQEVENRRESMNLANIVASGWVVDGDGVPIPVPATARAGSIAGSTRPSSGLSMRPGEEDDDMSVEADAPSSEPMAMVRSAASRASSYSEHRPDPFSEAEDDDEDALDDDEEFEEDDDLSDEEEDEERGVYHSAVAGREPIKWIKGALIGAGSFGNVFLGMNAKNGLLMAVKQVELPSGDSNTDQRKKSMLEALEREIELLKTMQHENIVQYLDSSGDGKHLNIFLEYVPGGSVVALLRNYGAFEEPLVRNFVRQILQGLSYLHKREIVHRDIKGANILVDNKSTVKISDFGISKKVESDLLVSARAHRPSLQGSVFWMAPEVVKQTSYTRKADIWSVGCLVVEMISGTHPWANLNQMQALFKIGSFAKPALPDDISQDCIDFLNATFELDYNDRPSADELLQHAFITSEFTGPAGAATADDGATPAAASSAVTTSNTGTVRSRKQAATRKARDAAQAQAASASASATVTTSTDADTSG